MRCFDWWTRNLWPVILNNISCMIRKRCSDSNYLKILRLSSIGVHFFFFFSVGIPKFFFPYYLGLRTDLVILYNFHCQTKSYKLVRHKSCKTFMSHKFVSLTVSKKHFNMNSYAHNAQFCKILPSVRRHIAFGPDDD